MNQVSVWFAQWKDVAEELVHSFLLYLPNLAGALLVLLLGWVVARVARALVIKLASSTNRALAGLLSGSRWVSVRLSDGATQIMANVVFWLFMLFALTAATRTAKIEFFAVWLDRMIAYLPGILGGMLIAFVGYLISIIVRDIATVTFAGAGSDQSRFLGAVAQAVIIILALIVGLEQAGIDVAFLTTIIGITVGAAAAGFSLAFGFGSRGFVSNLIGTYHMQRHMRPGQNVRIGQHEGEVLEFTPTGVVLATGSGRMMLPGKTFNEEAISFLTPDRHDDQ